ncbi:pyroglutamyl-peptidase I [Motilimonas cestriensis]|uniref:Pyroglutamyl-peptidase I n=1 Tax=Motilimonas cestriensis TaxID=2742685 RepID=A0ABS8W3K2_9GAMM|nr:pyroglutamyl-peptidase I [Motilimonas cestriensis]MCE2593504.1 pyroglutamyl-peptidase I [Motilimonas cestriensis]
MKTILVAGFEPFNGQTVNPASQILPTLANLSLAGGQIYCHQIPVVGQKAHAKLLQLIDRYQADVVIVLGQAAGRPDITLERVAINVDDFPIADNAGQQPLDQAIVEDGPAAYFSTLPIKHMRQAIVKKGIAASISNTAGTFVCNHVLYALLHSQRDREVQVGFIHLPLLPEQTESTNKPSMVLSEQALGIQSAIAALFSTPEIEVQVITGSQC